MRREEGRQTQKYWTYYIRWVLGGCIFGCKRHLYFGTDVQKMQIVGKFSKNSKNFVFFGDIFEAWPPFEYMVTAHDYEILLI